VKRAMRVTIVSVMLHLHVGELANVGHALREGPHP
jgi:hypothetical protein